MSTLYHEQTRVSPTLLSRPCMAHRSPAPNHDEGGSWEEDNRWPTDTYRGSIKPWTGHDLPWETSLSEASGCEHWDTDRNHDSTNEVASVPKQTAQKERRVEKVKESLHTLLNAIEPDGLSSDERKTPRDSSAQNSFPAMGLRIEATTTGSGLADPEYSRQTCTLSSNKSVHVPSPKHPSVTPATPRHVVAPIYSYDRTLHADAVPGAPSLSDDWRGIQKLRVEIWGLRSQIHELRGNLRETQQIKSAADDQLFRRMTTEVIGAPSVHREVLSHGQKTLKELMAESQSARDTYGPMEDDCNKLEDRLSGKEFRLARLEEPFYLRSAQAHVTMSAAKPSENQSATRPRSSSSLSDESEDLEYDDYHPMVARFLSRLGDLDLLQERLTDLSEEKTALEAQKQSRLQYGRTLDLDDQEWLDESQTEHENLVADIRSLGQEVKALKEECLAENLIDEYGDPTDFRVQQKSALCEEDDIDSSDLASENHDGSNK